MKIKFQIFLFIFLLIGCAKKSVEKDIKSPQDDYEIEDVYFVEEKIEEEIICKCEFPTFECIFPEVWIEEIFIEDNFKEFIEPLDNFEEKIVSPFYPPNKWGPFDIGVRVMEFFDTEQKRLLSTIVWYPAKLDGGSYKKAKYLMLLEGKAFDNPPPQKNWSPYPLVLFSHGFKGIKEQSFSFTEYVASHGFVVAAPDHQGNTLYDFSSSDEDIAKIAIARPKDISFVTKELIKLNNTQSDIFYGLINEKKVAVSGHSFGGYTAIMVSGGEVNVDNAQASCEAGTPADIFCPYIKYWEDGTVVKLDEKIDGLKAAIYFTPGGFTAFGDEGLKKVYVPSLIWGGGKDDTTPLDIEILPIYKGLPSPKIKIEIKDATHFSFTDICKIPFSEEIFKDFCKKDVIPSDKCFEIINTFSLAFLSFYLKEQTLMSEYLSKNYAEKYFPEVDYESE